MGPNLKTIVAILAGLSLSFACCQLCAQEKESAPQRDEKAAKRIHFDKMDLHDASIAEAVNAIIEKMKEQPPGNQVSMVLEMTPEELSTMPKLTMKANDASLEDLLEKICSICGLEFKYDARGIVIGKDLEEKLIVFFPIRPETAILIWIKSNIGKDQCFCADCPFESLHVRPVRAYIEQKGIMFGRQDAIALDLAKGKLTVKAEKSRLDKIKTILDEADAEAPKLSINPDAAVKWTESLPESIGHDEMLGAIALYWAQSNLKAAIQLLDKTSLRVRIKLLNSTIVAGAADNRELAMSLAKTLSSDRQKTMAAVAITGAEKDYLATMNLILSLPLGSSRSKAISGTLKAWAEKDAKTAQSFAQNLPDGIDRQIALGAFSPINKKLKEIVIDHLNYEDDTPISDIFRYLEKRSKEIDPEKTGVTIHYVPVKDKASSKADKREEAPKVVVVVDDIPLGEAIRYLCGAANLSYYVTDTKVLIEPENDAPGD